jgi:hypothetical protein
MAAVSRSADVLRPLQGDLRFLSVLKCKDGSNPVAGLIADGHGDLFGTTYKAQAGRHGLHATHSGSSWSETVLYAFCSQLNCGDGAGPVAPVIQDPTAPVRHRLDRRRQRRPRRGLRNHRPWRAVKRRG